MQHGQTLDPANIDGIRSMLAGSGYSEKAIQYYINKPSIGILSCPDQTSEMVGTCGDTMTVYLNIDQDIITDIKFQVLGCAGAVSAAMAVADLCKGRSLSYAHSITDGDVFRVLEEIPEKKHHCIQLAVKTFQKALKEYKGKQA